MSKIYGGRWKITESFAEGGQAQIFFVEDLSGKYTQPCVLKRIRNPKRRSRFISEVTACKKLSHPNIITLIDHSALDVPSDDEKMYLVMPYAKEGPLSEQVKMYENSIDSTLSVAKILAEALQHAHNSAIIHRDIKPENILFNDKSRNCVISDFGICLIRDEVRNTVDNEIVGPKYFMAPELEDGGVLNVKPSVDIYSLGKVIYYMLSGGVRLPRERHREKQYDVFTSKGMRHQLLGILLDKMICSVEMRIGLMSEVADELQRIMDWEEQSQQILSSKTIDVVSKIVEKDRDALSIREDNKKTAKQREEKYNEFLIDFEKWLYSYLKQVSTSLTQKNLVMVNVVEPQVRRESEIELDLKSLGKINARLRYVLEVAREVDKVHDKKGDRFRIKHGLLFFISRERKIKFRMAGTETRDVDTNVPIYFIPYCQKAGVNDWSGFLRKPNLDRGELVSRTFVGEGYTVYLHADASQWPVNKEAFINVMNEAIETFFKYIESGANMIGP